MPSISKRQKELDDVISTFDGDAQLGNHAKDTRGIPPTQDANDSASALRTTMRVRSPIFCSDVVQAHISAGFQGQQTGLRGS